MNTDDQHDFLSPRRGPAPLTPSELAEQLATDYPRLSIHPDAPLVGGMGAVYRATLTTNAGSRLVAIKVLHWHLMDDPAFTARFQREQALLRQLDHPNIIKLRDIGQTAEGLPFLVMDWIAGHSLTEFTQPGSTTDRQHLLRIADDLCAAAQHAHEKGILHRDLKPQNIIVTQEGRAIVLDFGIARSLRPGHTLTQPGDAPGTHGYIAPEVLAGEKPDARADIYSLGIIIYQLLMKKLPHLGSKFPSEASLDPRFDAIYRKAVADKAERFGTAAEFGAALNELMNQSPIHHHTMNAQTHLQNSHPVFSKRLPLILTACFVIGGGMYSYLSWNALDADIKTTASELSPNFVEPLRLIPAIPPAEPPKMLLAPLLVTAPSLEDKRRQETYSRIRDRMRDYEAKLDGDFIELVAEWTNDFEAARATAASSASSRIVSGANQMRADRKLDATQLKSDTEFRSLVTREIKEVLNSKSLRTELEAWAQGVELRTRTRMIQCFQQVVAEDLGRSFDEKLRGIVVNAVRGIPVEQLVADSDSVDKIEAAILKSMPESALSEATRKVIKLAATQLTKSVATVVAESQGAGEFTPIIAQGIALIAGELAEQELDNLNEMLTAKPDQNAIKEAMTRGMSDWNNTIIKPRLESILSNYRRDIIKFLEDNARAQSEILP